MFCSAIPIFLFPIFYSVVPHLDLMCSFAPALFPLQPCFVPPFLYFFVPDTLQFWSVLRFNLFLRASLCSFLPSCFVLLFLFYCSLYSTMLFHIYIRFVPSCQPCSLCRHVLFHCSYIFLFPTLYSFGPC
jgi:hypothetical protein